MIRATSFAANNCLEIEFEDADLCIAIDKDGNDYTLDTDIDNAEANLALTCHILLPDGEDRNVSYDNCQGEFEYDDNDTSEVKLYIIVNGEYQTIEEEYDFDDGDWYGNVGSSNSDGELDDFELAASNTTPEDGERIDIDIEAIDNNNDTVEDYDGKIRFKVEIRDDSDNERVIANRSDYDLDRSYYNFDPDDNGKITLEELVRITTDEGEFRLRVYDNYDEDIEAFIEFDMDGESSNLDADDLEEFDFYYVEDTTPDRREWISVKIEATDGSERIYAYEETVTLKFEIKDESYRDNTTRSDLQIRSDDFYEDEYDLDYGELEVDFINGRLEFEVNFDDEEEYKITVEDGNIDKYKRFYVGDSNSSNGEINSFELDASSTRVTENDRIDIEIEALDEDGYRVSDYDAKARFSVEIRDDTDDERIAANYRDYDLDENYHNFNSNDNGYIKINDLLVFKNEGEFRLRVYDDDNEEIEEYIEFDVDNDNNNNEFDRFKVTTNPKYPNLKEWFDVTIEAVDGDGDTYEDYDGTVRFRIEKKYGNYRSIARSDYYSLDRNEINFNSADAGEIDINELIKFKEKGLYRVKFYDEDNTTKYAYKEFSIRSEDEDENSNVDGFTNKEYDQLKAVYNIRPNIIKQLSRDYRRLRYDNDREDESNNLYDNMKDVVDNNSGREFDDYDDFFDAFLDRYSLTISVR